jgi:hypothetical protein
MDSQRTDWGGLGRTQHRQTERRKEQQPATMRAEHQRLPMRLLFLVALDGGDDCSDVLRYR